MCSHGMCQCWKEGVFNILRHEILMSFIKGRMFTTLNRKISIFFIHIFLSMNAFGK